MAERGHETLRFGPMKPVGLADPHKGGTRPYAVVQLRQDNALGTLWNMVGFQTKLKHGEQARVFRMIPGLQEAEFARLGGLHRNTFLNSPKLLDAQLRLKAMSRLRFAGQITGVEGYVESAACGLCVGVMLAEQLAGRLALLPPATTALGALLGHLRRPAKDFQPSNVVFSMFPPLEASELGSRGRKGRKERRALLVERALSALPSFAGHCAPTLASAGE
jgi:methylenetetrahydrofolate--tRNA-(uracil-5-)-methyltransferase